IFKLWDNDITLQTLAPEETYEPGCDGTPKFVVLLLYMQRAWDESQRRSQRIGANWEHWRTQVAAGHIVKPPCRPPAWIKWEGTTANPVPGAKPELLPSAVATIQRIFKWAAEGMGLERIVKRLNRDGTPNLGRKDSWRISSLAQLLHTRDVLGEITTK